MTIYVVRIDELLKHVNPLNGKTWKCDPISISEVEEAIKAAQFDSRGWSELNNTLEPEAQRQYHIERIALLASNPIETNDPNKVAVCIGKDQIWIYDGNHRIAAAVVRGDTTMALVLAPYDEAVIPHYFPSATRHHPGANQS